MFSAVTRQLRTRHISLQANYKHVLLILFLAVNTLAILVFIHDYSPSDHKTRSNDVDVTLTVVRHVLSGSNGSWTSLGHNNFGSPIQRIISRKRTDLESSTDDPLILGDVTHGKRSSNGITQLGQKDSPNSFLQDLEFVKSPSNFCRDQKPYLIIGVCSAVQRLDLRDAIRKTWGSISSKRNTIVRVVFVLGQPEDKWLHLHPVIKEENERYGDILQIDFMDNYTNLSLKSLGFFHWLNQNCQGVRYVMKSDDDVFLNVPNLLKELSNMAERGSKFIMGHVMEGAKPITDCNDKWFMPSSIYRNRTYPTYLSGTAYVMPFTLAGELYKKSLQRPVFWLEDIYITGMLANDVGVSLVHNPKFLYRRSHMAVCDYRKIVSGHEIQHTELYRIWRDLHRDDLHCESGRSHLLGRQSFRLSPRQATND